MKHQDTITNKIVKNINYALEAIPRALTMEKEKPVRKSRNTSSRSRKSGTSLASKARRAGGRAKRRVSAMGAKASRRTNVAKLPKRGRKTGTRKAIRGRSGRRSSRSTTMAHAA
jgi:hypothetical protein